jgi:hypothetical protein
MGTLVSCLDATPRSVGGAPTYLLTDNEKTVTIEHVAGVAVPPSEDGRGRQALRLRAAHLRPLRPGEQEGLASGLGEAVFDRALSDPTWLRARLAEVDAGEPRRAKEWGKAAIEWADVQVCWTTTPDRASALALELTVLRTLHADPLWNRHR